MTQAQNDTWFRPKRYGYGAEPSNWKGWVATMAYIALVVAITLPLVAFPAMDGAKLSGGEIATWVAIMVVLTVAFVWMCWIKTDGDWRWRWGSRD